MKSILISIKPEWVEKILNGEKTIEIRKTMPKCELPCKVYIYCSKGKYGLTRCMMTEEDKIKGKWTYQRRIVGYLNGEPLTTFGQIDGKVVAEFTLDIVEKYGWMYSPLLFADGYMKVSENNLPRKELNYKACCITKKEIADYADDGGILPAPVFAWYINDLKIYDKPKELKDFLHPCKNLKGNKCSYVPWCKHIGQTKSFLVNHTYTVENAVCLNYVKRPPQSWCYVEEESK